MRLKTKNLNWAAGRPVVIVGENVSKKLDVHVNEKVFVRYKAKKIYAVVDIFPEIVSSCEIGLSEEISSLLGNRSGEEVEVGLSEMQLGASIVKKKISGKELSAQELKILIDEISSNNLTEVEVAYFIAGEKFYGMSESEIVNLIRAMIDNGKKVSFNGDLVADKHCIGGIAGNRTTPIVVSICAEAGLKMPKSSSKAITSASGTADVLATIANVDLSVEEIKKVVQKTNACLVWGGSIGLAPSDDKIIRIERALNLDVEPQLVASILSKKIAAGSNHILIDIPYGGGKIESRRDARKLGEKFFSIGKHFGLKIRAVYSDGTKPVGKGIGPVLEMIDVLDVLQNNPCAPNDLREKAIYLASELMELCGIKSARKEAEEILSSGRAYKKFKEIINFQNGENDFEKRVSKLRPAKFRKTIYSPCDGRIVEMNDSKINSLCRILGTPESTSAGIFIHRNVGRISKSDRWFTIYAESMERLEEGMKFFKDNFFRIGNKIGI